MFDYRSWGNQPSGWHRVYRHLKPGAWALQRLIADEPETLLPYGNGRSYGDVCLNPGHALVDARALNRILHFDPRDGILHCEAGVTFARILELATAHGWFAPVVPSTKYLTVGGAIANDVHGRDHVK